MDFQEGIERMYEVICKSGATCINHFRDKLWNAEFNYISEFNNALGLDTLLPKIVSDEEFTKLRKKELFSANINLARYIKNFQTGNFKTRSYNGYSDGLAYYFTPDINYAKIFCYKGTNDLMVAKTSKDAKFISRKKFFETIQHDLSGWYSFDESESVTANASFDSKRKVVSSFSCFEDQISQTYFAYLFGYDGIKSKARYAVINRSAITQPQNPDINRFLG